jgi:hypothetical protein
MGIDAASASGAAASVASVTGSTRDSNRLINIPPG